MRYSTRRFANVDRKAPDGMGAQTGATADASPLKPHDFGRSMLTDRDFEKMEWHDVKVHAIAMTSEFPRRVELMLDLDYILQWVDPNPPEEYYNFWLAPATLVFENVAELSVRLQTEQLECQIDELKREAQIAPGGARSWRWNLSLHQGEISFLSTGYKQYFRQRPILHKKQHFTQDERGGVSFSRTTNS